MLTFRQFQEETKIQSLKAATKESIKKNPATLAVMAAPVPGSFLAGGKIAYDAYKEYKKRRQNQIQ
jgi:uncharacterized membrane protein YebE (DUF533 family)